MLFFIHVGFHAILFLILEILFKTWRFKNGPIDNGKVTKVMTNEEYEYALRAGKKYCIIDDLVLDVGRYASRHPGGAFLIDMTIGRDVSKYFYGGYKLENSKSNRDKPYRHSQLARRTV